MDLFSQATKPVDGIRVGIGGWTYAPWRNNFYPNGLVQRRELEYASRQLTAIEINGTFYGTQKPATYAQVGDGNAGWLRVLGQGADADHAVAHAGEDRTADRGFRRRHRRARRQARSDRVAVRPGPRCSAKIFAAFLGPAARRTSTDAACGMCSTCAIRHSSTPTTSRCARARLRRRCSPTRPTIRRSPTSPPTSSMRA